jgi:hypothetical protein
VLFSIFTSISRSSPIPHSQLSRLSYSPLSLLFLYRYFFRLRRPHLPTLLLCSTTLHHQLRNVHLSPDSGCLYSPFCNCQRWGSSGPGAQRTLLSCI